MTIPVLLAATATTWLGTARLPRALVHAGFDVALLAPRHSLAEKSAFIARVGHLPDAATPMQWLYAFAAMVRATSPRLVIPCDDTSFTLLQDVVLSPPDGLGAALQLQLAALIRESLGDPRHYRASIDKTLLPQAAQACGVRMPPQAVVTRGDDARAFAAANGFPVVLKRGHGFAGQAVRICADADALTRDFAALTRPDAGGGGGAGTLVVQAQVAGPSLARTSAGWCGRELAGVTRERLMRNPPDTGPPTVGRFHCDPEVRDCSRKLIAELGLTGFCAIEYLRDGATGELFLLEINRRVTPGVHAGALVGVDLCAALHGAIAGAPVSVPDDLPPHFSRIIAQFPQEWLRDPDSAYLLQYPADVPWDEPELFEAMLALRHG